MVDDDVLPAAPHLTSDHAFDVIAPAVARTGGELVTCVATQVQFRPGCDLVVRYRTSVRTSSGVVEDTVFAGVTTAGPPDGTLVVEATTGPEQRLQVGVWRWPFDPVLRSLEQIVTPHLLRDVLGALTPDRPAIEVVAFRPTERAVVRIGDRDGIRPAVYVKVVDASSTSTFVTRHDDLRRCGVPAPAVLASGPGWYAMEALAGPTLRDLVKSGTGPWPTGATFVSMLERLGEVRLSDPAPARSRDREATAHAKMLAVVLPGERSRLDAIVDRIDQLAPRTAPDLTTVHGDFHEAQVVVDGTDLTGLLDIDDVGVGDRVADASTLLAHLLFRARTTPSHGDRIRTYANALRHTFSSVHEPAELDRMTAAALVGLATGPFRVRQVEWEQASSAVLDEVDRLLGRGRDRSTHVVARRPIADEGHLSRPSRSPHPAPAR